MLMCEKIGDTVFREKPEQALVFVEQALRPNTQGLVSTREDPESWIHGIKGVDSDSDEKEEEGQRAEDSDDEDDEPLAAEEALDVEDIGKLGLQETAITLLMAVLTSKFVSLLENCDKAAAYIYLFA